MQVEAVARGRPGARPGDGPVLHGGAGMTSHLPWVRWPVFVWSALRPELAPSLLSKSACGT